MPRTPLVLFLSFFFATAIQALQFTNATPTGQLGYQPITAVATSHDVVYAATGGKLFRSSDDGTTWSALDNPTSSIEKLAVDPSDSAVVYLVGQMHTYRSDDSGATWNDVTPALGTILASELRIDPNDSTVYLASHCGSYTNPFNGGVHKSTDRGVSWLHLSPSVNCVDFLSLDPGEPRRLFAGTTTGANYRTDDNGRSWQQTSGEVPIFDAVADPLEPSRHYGLGRGPAGDRYVHFLLSANDGASWSRLDAQGLPEGAQHIAIDRVTRRLFITGQSFGLFVSDDLGLHWRRITAVPNLPVASLSMAATSDTVFVATALGLMRVSMSEPDVPATIHLGEAAPLQVLVYSIALDPNDASTLYATTLEGLGILNVYPVFRSRDAGRTWERITGGDETVSRNPLAVDAAGDLYAVRQQTMWRFSKATQTWETWTAPDLSPPAHLVANPQRPAWLYAANPAWAGYSTDGGHSWTRIANVTGFWSLSIAPNGNDLVGGNNDGAFASNDGGVTWRALPTGTLVTKAVAIAPSRPQTIYRLTNTGGGGLLSGLFRSDDGGTTWRALHWPGEHEAPSVPVITVDPLDDRSVWIGLAHSTDGGETWRVEPSNLPYGASSVAFNRNGTVLFAVGGDLSVWQAVVRGSHRRAMR